MKIFLICGFLCLSLLSGAQGTFQKLYFSSIEGDARYLKQCSDSGFIFSAGSNLTGINIFKTDSNGFIDWVYVFPYSCQGFNVIETRDHNFIVSGFRNENAGIRLAPFILKISSSGSLIWSRGYNFQNSLIQSFSTSAVIQSNDSGYVLMSALPVYWNGSYDIVVIKTDSSGNVIWNQCYGGTSNEWGITIIKVRPSGYIIFGNTDSFGSASKMIFKINESGAVEWTSLVGSPIPWVNGEPIQQTDDYGYIFLCGGINNNSICKLDSSGNFLWSKSFTSIHDLYMSSLLQTRDAGIAVSGYLNDATSNHAFIVKLDSLGNTMWTKYFNDSLSCSSVALTMVQTFDEGFAFSGSHVNQSIPYFFLVKTDSLGNLSCPGSDIPGFQSSSYNNPDSLINLSSQFLTLSDSSVSSNYNNFFYSEMSFCFAPINTSVVETKYASVVISPNPFHSSAKLNIISSFIPKYAGDNAQLKIYNTMGSLIRIEHVSNITSYILHRSGLSNGLYFYELMTNDAEVIGNGKFVVE